MGLGTGKRVGSGVMEHYLKMQQRHYAPRQAVIGELYTSKGSGGIVHALRKRRVP